jgi:hypothetical protein
MAYREFVDEDGREWKAWDVKPTPRFGEVSRRMNLPREESDQATLTAHVSPGWESGWLAFQAEGMNRRLRPIPAGWESADDEVLRQYLRLAVTGTQRKSS